MKATVASEIRTALNHRAAGIPTRFASTGRVMTSVLMATAFSASLLLPACALDPNASHLFADSERFSGISAETDSDQDSIADYMDQCAQTEPGIPVSAEGCPLDSDGDGVPDYRDKCPDSLPGTAGCGAGCNLVEPVVFNLVNDEFDFDTSTLKLEMKQALDGFIDGLNMADGVLELIVVGHTDSIGTHRYNQRLSERRAAAVTEYLQLNNVNAATVESRGNGETDPVSTNETEPGRASNRRVEIFAHVHPASGVNRKPEASGNKTY